MGLLLVIAGFGLAGFPLLANEPTAPCLIGPCPSDTEETFLLIGIGGLLVLAGVLVLLFRGGPWSQEDRRR